jgi:hypothetical protein
VAGFTVIDLKVVIEVAQDAVARSSVVILRERMLRLSRLAGCLVTKQA